MKKILALAALVTGISFGTMAQEAPKKQDAKPRMQGKKEMTYKTPEEFAKIRTERLDKELKFTDAQREQVYKLNLEQAKKQKDRQSKMLQERNSQREEMRVHHEKFQKILTPEQQKLVKDKFAKGGKRDSLHRRGEKTLKDGGPKTKIMKIRPSEKS